MCEVGGVQCVRWEVWSVRWGCAVCEVEGVQCVRWEVCSA